MESFAVKAITTLVAIVGALMLMTAVIAGGLAIGLILYIAVQ